jgi:hypothetical protein
MKTLLKQFFSKISNWIYFWIWLILTLWVFGLVYAALSWIPQTTVWTGSGLTATAWNDMINNMWYLKENVESKLSTNWDGSALTWLTKTQVGLWNVDDTSDATKSVLSATKLTTARTINWISFNWTANITIPVWTLTPDTCAWVNVTTCGHACGITTYYQAICPAGKYMAWWSTNTYNEYTAYNFRIYCCNP